MGQLFSGSPSERNLATLVENKTTFSAEYAELNVFETYQIAEKVALTFKYPVIASMLTGKKIMHLEGMDAFDFVPGQSVVMPSHKEMVIDFPIAKYDEPTQCLALGIDSDKINDVVSHFNTKVAIENENNTWQIDASASHLAHAQDVNLLVQRLVQTFISTDSSKDVLLDLMIQELVIRLLQTQARSVIMNDGQNRFSDTRIGAVVRYIKENLTNKDLDVESMARKACMSASHFHKKFKNTLGVSPIDYVNSEKIKFAKKLIKEEPRLQVSEVAYMSGFNNVSYFNRQFKKMELITPLQFKQSV